MSLSVQSAILIDISNLHLDHNRKQHMQRTWVYWIIVLASSTAASADVPFVPGFDRFYASKPTADGGRILISELSCTACHAATNITLEAKRGPSLKGAGLRLRAAWLRRFLANPQSAKPGSTMPDMLHGMVAEKRRKTIDALVAFLSTQQEAFPTPNSTAGNPIAFEFWRKGDGKHGRELFHQIGCVACHEPDAEYAPPKVQMSQLEKLLAQLAPDELEEMGLTNAARPVNSVPLGDLAAKYSRRSLAFFVHNPIGTRPAGRMPNLGLSHAEAADITEYLLREQRADIEVRATKPNEGLIAEGRVLFQQLRCANCHTVQQEFKLSSATLLENLKLQSEASCFKQSQSGRPRYTLNAKQSESLALAIQSVVAKKRSTISSANFRMMQLNCFACHERAGLGSVGLKRRRYFETHSGIDFGDEGRLPPPLDHVGRKLSQAWLTQAISGKATVRPHMQIRMPAFSAHAKPLAEDLKTDDIKQKPLSGKAVFGDVKGLAEAGRELLDTGCIQCHPLRDERLPGVIGIDLEGVTSRISPQWFQEFLLNPGALKPRTRMPTFFPNGRSSNQDILAGDVNRQVAAIWLYLKELKKQKLPDKILAGKEHDFEVTPKDRPVVMRTFMKRVGLQAIAVGFPQKVHFAFDSKHAILVQAWRGRFLDAHGTWFDRFTPLAQPLGKDVMNFPLEVPIATQGGLAPWPLLKKSGYQFRGFRLDASGVPTFLYRFSDFDIQDRISPGPAQSLSRRLTITDRRKSGGKRELWFRANAGKSIKAQKLFSYTNDAGLNVTVDPSIRHVGELRATERANEWLIPFTIDGKTTIGVTYKW